LNAERAIIGENVGARDIREGEMVTGFGSKTLGEADTLHKIAPPKGIEKFIGFASLPLRGPGQEAPDEANEAYAEEAAYTMRSRTPGWRLVALSGSGANNGAPCLEQRFETLKDAAAAAELIGRIEALVGCYTWPLESIGVEGNDVVVARLRTADLPGVGACVSHNDFVMAARINGIDLKDLKKPPKKRNWI